MASAADLVGECESDTHPSKAPRMLVESVEVVVAARVRIANPDSRTFTGIATHADRGPVVASRLPFDAERVRAQGRTRLHFGAMRIAQKIKLLARIVHVVGG